MPYKMALVQVIYLSDICLLGSLENVSEAGTEAVQGCSCS